MLYAFVEIVHYERMLGYLNNMGTDAEQLEKLTKIHDYAWALAWAILSVGVFIMALHLVVTGTVFPLHT